MAADVAEAPEAVLDPLTALLERAQVASDGMGADNPNRRLIADMALLLIDQAQRIAFAEEQLADKPRIILP